jgi:cobalt/nickel transport system permease protein
MALHHNVFDRYIDSDSVIHRLDPRVKVVLTVLFILSNALLPVGAWLAYVAAMVVVVIVCWQAHYSIWSLLKRSLIVGPFLLAAVTVVFSVPGETVWSGPGGIIATDAGLVRFASIVIRSWVSVQMAILLTATTQFPDILHALRHLRVPDVLISILAFMYRYLFVLADEVTRMLRARASRSAGLPGRKSGGSIRWRAKVAGNMVGQLMTRSMSRSDRVYNAMLARGYRGHMMTMNPHHMHARDWGALWAAAIALILIQFIGRI